LNGSFGEQITGWLWPGAELSVADLLAEYLPFS